MFEKFLDIYTGFADGYEPSFRYTGATKCNDGACYAILSGVFLNKSIFFSPCSVEFISCRCFEILSKKFFNFQF